MFELKGRLTGSVFGIDSKKFYKETYDRAGVKKEFRALMGAIINAEDNLAFEESYDSTLEQLFNKYGLSKRRPVYSSSDIAFLFGPNTAGFFSFCAEFTDAILRLENIKINFFFTRINPTYLKDDGKVTLYGEYGTATKGVSVGEFIDRIENYYNIICAWKLTQIMDFQKGLFLFDGTEGIMPCPAWEEFSKQQYARIIFNGDKIVPIISTSDILVRHIEKELKVKRGPIDENAIRDIVLRGKGIKQENKFFRYIGNPDLGKIKPRRSYCLTLGEMRPFIHHPIIFLSAGDIAGQSSMMENTPLFDRVLELASAFHAGVRFYDPKRDRYLIGSGEKDYFFAANDTARMQLQTLVSCGLTIEELKI